LKNRSNIIAERINLARNKKLGEEDKKKKEAMLKIMNEAFKVVDSNDRIYGIYLKILYSYYFTSIFRDVIL